MQFPSDQQNGDEGGRNAELVGHRHPPRECGPQHPNGQTTKDQTFQAAPEPTTHEDKLHGQYCYDAIPAEPLPQSDL